MTRSVTIISLLYDQEKVSLSVLLPSIVYPKRFITGLRILSLPVTHEMYGRGVSLCKPYPLTRRSEVFFLGDTQILLFRENH